MGAMPSTEAPVSKAGGWWRLKASLAGGSLRGVLEISGGGISRASECR